MNTLSAALALLAFGLALVAFVISPIVNATSAAFTNAALQLQEANHAR